MKQLIYILSLSLFISCQSKTNPVTSEEDLSAYLLVYFQDPTHSLYFALSSDGYSFTSVNEGNPVMSGDTLSTQKGIRDPHIYRGPDGYFYMVMTDLHIFAQREGLRESEWERDGAQYGWGNNRGFVLMKSKDLINWSRSNFIFEDHFEGYEDMAASWAPQSIYDKERDQMLVYFTMRFKDDGINRLYYSYANKDFTALETEPQILFEYPVPDKSYIDGDLTEINGKYHLFYVSHDGTPGIKQAISDKLTGEYVYDPSWYDPESSSCEAPNIWKRIGEDKWVLMYDVYGIKVHNFGFSETTNFKDFENLGHFNEGIMKSTNFTSPKHGAVIHLTKSEAEVLAKHWNLALKFH